jgi:hypothetical protein
MTERNEPARNPNDEFVPHEVEELRQAAEQAHGPEHADDTDDDEDS